MQNEKNVPAGAENGRQAQREQPQVAANVGAIGPVIVWEAGDPNTPPVSVPAPQGAAPLPHIDGPYFLNGVLVNAEQKTVN